MIENPYMDPSAYQRRLDLEEFHQVIEQVKKEIEKIIVGQPRLVELMLAALLAEGHVLIEGVPGVAKTLTAKLLARSISASFSRIQFTPDLMPSDVLGTNVFNAQTTQFEFRSGPIFSQLVLIDEINRAPAKTQAALFEVMEEKQITIDGTTHKMKPPFFVMATQNPIEQEGTYRLPEAQLDRFLFKIEVDYPSEEAEVKFLSDAHHRRQADEISTINPVIDAEQIQQFQQTVQAVYIEEKLLNYIVSIVRQTRSAKELYLGASPRASLSLMRTSKAIAAMRGRDFVTPEDIQYMAPSVLHHRVILTPEKEMEGGSPSGVIKQLVSQIEVPR